MLLMRMMFPLVWCSMDAFGRGLTAVGCEAARRQPETGGNESHPPLPVSPPTQANQARRQAASLEGQTRPTDETGKTRRRLTLTKRSTPPTLPRDTTTIVVVGYGSTNTSNHKVPLGRRDNKTACVEERPHRWRRIASHHTPEQQSGLSFSGSRARECQRPERDSLVTTRYRAHQPVHPCPPEQPVFACPGKHTKRGWRPQRLRDQFPIREPNSLTASCCGRR